jgi:hypothetical protein
MYEFFEAENIDYAIRLPANLADEIGYLLKPRGRATAARGAPLLRQLHLSGAELEHAAPRRGQGRGAPRRALPARRPYRHQLGAAGQAPSPSTTNTAPVR